MWLRLIYLHSPLHKAIIEQERRGTMEQADAFLTTRKEEETAYVGEILGGIIREPLVIALQGELGAGKTVFVRGAARGLETGDQVSSPTFVLMKIYQGRLPLYHFDFYRLSEDEDETSELGFEEYLPGDGAAFVEWADRLPVLIPPDHLLVRLELFHDQYGEGRRIWFTPYGNAARQVVEKVTEAIAWRTDGSLKQP